eukprot:6717407-Pyramimonas_sp.AAC.1
MSSKVAANNNWVVEWLNKGLTAARSPNRWRNAMAAWERVEERLLRSDWRGRDDAPAFSTDMPAPEGEGRAPHGR